MSEQETYHRCLNCNDIIENRTLKRCWDCYFKCYPVAIGTMDDFVSANPDRKRKRNEMNEQEKTGVEVKESTYICDWNGSSWMFKRPSGEAIETRSDLLNELGTLLARAKKTEAALESAQKMSDHWEVRAKDWKFHAERNHEAWRNREKLVWNADVALNAAKVETHYTDADGNRTPLTLGERIKLLEKDRNEWKLCDLNSKQEEVSPIQTDPIDWNRVRIDAAIAVIQGMYANPSYNVTVENSIAELASCQANALVAELKKEVQA